MTTKFFILFDGFWKHCDSAYHKMESDSTTISIFISEHPIDWDGHDVKIVILLSLSASDRKVFIELFDVIADLFTDNDYVKKLNAQMTYLELMQHTKNSIRQNML